MPHFDFSDGTRRLLRTHPALSSTRIRELGFAFNAAQSEVCRALAALAAPLAQTMDDLRGGRGTLFREGSDRDRKGSLGMKAAYRFAGFTASHVEEYESSRLRCAILPRGSSEAWEADFLMRFTFEVIEQVARRAQDGNAPLEAALGGARRIRDEMLAGNLLLVARTVIRCGRLHPSIVPDDLFTAGTDGLLVAINRYDPTVGQFSTYAMPWMRMAMDRFVANSRHVIRIPVGMQAKVRRHKSEAGRAEGGRAEAPLLIPEVQSLEEPVPGLGDGELRLEELVSDPLASLPCDALEQADTARILRDGMREMDGLRQFVIAMRSDVGDAAAIGARLFREEIALSLSRGRSIAEAAAKSLDDPARIRMAGAVAAVPVEAEEESELALAG